MVNFTMLLFSMSSRIQTPTNDQMLSQRQWLLPTFHWTVGQVVMGQVGFNDGVHPFGTVLIHHQESLVTGMNHWLLVEFSGLVLIMESLVQQFF